MDFRFLYTGREFDPETGLYQYRARYYDAATGRFLSEDPIGFEAGDVNLYRYVGNNPLIYVDPFGLFELGLSSTFDDEWLDIESDLSNSDFDAVDYAFGSGERDPELQDFFQILDTEPEDLGIIDNGARRADALTYVEDTVALLDTLATVIAAVPTGGQIFNWRQNLHGDVRPYGYDINAPAGLILDKLDETVAGFGSFYTLGGTDWLREQWYGELATANHEGFFYNSGQVLGVASSMLLGELTPDKLAGLTLAQKFGGGVDVVHTFAGAYQSTRSIIETGEIGFDDLLNFAPAIGYLSGRGLHFLDKLVPRSVNRGVGMGEELLQGGAFPDSISGSYTPQVNRLVIGQSFDFSCVAGACRMLLADFGIDIPEAYIRSAAGVDLDGAYLSNLPDALRNLGSYVDNPELARFVFRKNQSIAQLQSAMRNGPVIASVTTDIVGGAHAVVIDKIENGLVLLRDPLPVGVGTAQSIPLDYFSQSFTGNLVFRQ